MQEAELCISLNTQSGKRGGEDVQQWFIGNHNQETFGYLEAIYTHTHSICRFFLMSVNEVIEVNVPC